MEPHSGEELKKLRESKGISLHDVAQSTRMSISILEALENDQSSDVLPLVYQSMARNTYARFLAEASEKKSASSEASK